MKTFLLIALVVVVFSAGEDCVKQKCPSQYNACVAEVFGCATKALNCQTKCGETDPCYRDCAYASGNKKLIALYECGQQYCSDTDIFTTIQEECDVERCVNAFQLECLEELNLKSVQCMMGFQKRHPECSCMSL